MSDRPGVSTTVPDDARSTVLRSITKQARKSKDGLDHRDLSELSAHLRSLHYNDIRTALAELQDEGLIRRGMTTVRGEGWGLAEDKTNLQCCNPEDIFLMADERRRVASPTGCGTLGVRSGVAPTGDEQREVPPTGHRGYGRLLRTSPGTGEVQVLRGRDITKKPGRTADPDTPFGLATYFSEVAQEKGFTWGASNRQALMHWFKEAKETGMSPEDIRKLVRVFFLKPEVIRGVGKPPWRLFLNQREALAKQTGVRTTQPVAPSVGRTREEMLAYWAPPEKPMTQEEMNERRPRWTAWWRP